MDSPRLREETICPLCFDVFNNPRSLPCLHSYCEECLYKLHRSTGMADSITCPECRATTMLDRQGINGLKINFKLKRIVEILSEEEREELVRKSSRHYKPLPPLPPPTCDLHPDKQLDFYCKQCSTLICSQCMLETHRFHNTPVPAADALLDRLESLKLCTLPADNLLSKANKALHNFQLEATSIQRAAEADITCAQNYFKKLRSILEQREREVSRSIQVRASRQEGKIAKQKQLLLKSMEDLQTSTAMVQDIVERRKDDIRILAEKNIAEKIDSQTNHLALLIGKAKDRPNSSYQSPFVVDPTFEAQCKEVGDRSEVGSPTHGYQSRHTFVGQPAAIRQRAGALTNRSKDSRTFSQSLDGGDSPTLLSPLVAKRGSDSLSWSSESLAIDSSIKQSYDIDGAPILTPTIVVSSSTLLGPMQKPTSASPYGVCVGNANTLIVADSKNHMFSILTPTGKFLHSVQAEGKGDGQFLEPTAVTCDQNGKIIIVDKGAPPKVQTFSDAGKFLSKFKVRGGLPYGTYLGEPLGVAVLQDKSVLVSDSEKACVHVFEEDGKYRGKFGESELKLKQPAGMAVDSRGNVVVADRGNHCIWIFTCGGQYLSRAGKQGSGPGDLLYPYGVAIDRDGNIFISESGNHRISEFTAGGKYLRSFGKKGSEPGMFMYPRHLCVDSQGRLVVADEHNQRLQIFDIVD